MSTNNEWYNLNELRDYPFAAGVSATSDAGQQFPTGLIADIQLRWPSNYGNFAFISAIHTSSNLTTLIIDACTDPVSSANKQSIAGITLPSQDIVTYRTVALQALVPGVGGFISFGHDTKLPFSATFSSYAQSGLSTKTARSNKDTNIKSLSLISAERTLSGDVRITVADPLTVKREIRTIDGVEYTNVIVFSLSDPPGQLNRSGLLSSALNTFVGPCGKRFEAKNCGDPQPIEFINSVSPDCNNEITIEFEGCVSLGTVSNTNTIFIDCGVPASNNCPPPYIADDNGVLPQPPVSIRPPVDPGDPEPPDPGPCPPITANTEITLLGLPHCVTFDNQSPSGFFHVVGTPFSFVEDDSPTEAVCHQGIDGIWDISQPYSYGSFGRSTGNKNITIFTSDVQTLYRKYRTDVKIRSGSSGSKFTAGLLINHHIFTDCGPSYYGCVINAEKKQIQIVYFNRGQTTVVAEATVGGIKTDEWYHLTLAARPIQNGSAVSMIGTVAAYHDDSVATSLSTSIPCRAWLPDSGKPGLLVDYAEALFSYYRIEHYV
jgi:hypothetical protein